MMIQPRCRLERVPCEYENSNECMKRVFRNYEKHSLNTSQIRGGNRFGVQGVGFESFGFQISGLGVPGFRFRVSNFGFRLPCFVYLFRAVSGFMSRDWSLCFRIRVSASLALSHFDLVSSQ